MAHTIKNDKNYPSDFDIIIVGSGAAGLTASLFASRKSPDVRIALISNGQIGQSNSIMAQGGMQFPEDCEDSKKLYVQDMLTSAQTEIDLELLTNLASKSVELFKFFKLEGFPFKKNDDGSLNKTIANGLSEPRVYNTESKIGPVLIKFLKEKLSTFKNIELFPLNEVIEISPSRSCFELSIKDVKSEMVQKLSSKAIICCTGGSSFHYANQEMLISTNPKNNNHQFFESLKKFKLSIVEEKDYQFHPFGLVDFSRGQIGLCLPEPIIQFESKLIDNTGKQIVEFGMHTNRLHINQAIFKAKRDNRLFQSHQNHFAAKLTFSLNDKNGIIDRFPYVKKYIENSINNDQIEIFVFPFVHYQLGGYKINKKCETVIPGLFLAGEIVGGIHGHNRLMGNAITDSMTHGMIAGEQAVNYIDNK